MRESDQNSRMGDPTLPSAMHHFTAEFGMESGGSNALMPPGKLFGRKQGTDPDFSRHLIKPIPRKIGVCPLFPLPCLVRCKAWVVAKQDQ